MFAGGILLALTAAVLGEFRDFHPQTVSLRAWFSLVYLIVAGSIIAFTAYVWLIHHESPTKVATYAYVNPVIAVFLGWLFANEPIGSRTIIAAVIILAGVAIITATQGASSHHTDEHPLPIRPDQPRRSAA